MFEIKYGFTNESSLDISIVDETDLRYKLFPGSIILRKGNNLINLDWDWIPIIDFALNLLLISNKLSLDEGREELDFTESDEKLIFERQYETIRITSTFSQDLLEIGFQEFYEVSIEFYKNAMLNIIEKNPGLKHNNIFLKYMHYV